MNNAFAPVFNKTSSPARSFVRGNLPPLLLVLIVLLYAFFKCARAQLSMAGSLGFAMDDAWIHVAVARNFAEGLGWGIVPGKTLSVSTSPTWTLLLSFFFLFFSDPVKITLLCSLACMAAAAILSYLLAYKLTESRLLAALAAVLLIVSPISLWGLVSGLELPLSLAALMLALYLYYSSGPASLCRKAAVPAAIAFAAITRPELFVLIPLALLDTFYSNIRSKNMAWRVACMQCVIFAAALCPYFLFNVYSHGKIFPATYYAKTIVRGVGLLAAASSGDSELLRKALIGEPLRQIFSLIDELKTENAVMLLLLSVGALAFAGPFANQATRRGALLPLALLLIPYAMGVSSPSKYMSNHAGRYFVIFPPLAILLGCMGIKFLAQHARLRALPLLACLAALWFPYRSAAPTLRHIGIDAESTQRLYVEMPIWIRDNLEANAVLAVNDIGGLAYFTRRDMIDVMGLATPAIWPAIFRRPGKPIDIRKMRQFLKDHRVNYAILSPRYYPELTNDKKLFEPLHEWRESYEHGRTISPQILYRLNWSSEEVTR